MLAYLFWHRPAAGVARAAYERELLRFHRSLAHRPPSGFRGSIAFRAPQLPWVDATGEGSDGGGYEDWYLLESWSAVGVLEEAALARGHVSAHDAVARRLAAGTGSVYRLREGGVGLAEVRVSVWVSRPTGAEVLGLAELLRDGIDPQASSLWRRCLALGPAPELCLLGADPEALGERTGVAPGRLPAGWSATVHPREPLGG
jgi:hypothetical protein